MATSGFEVRANRANTSPLKLKGGKIPSGSSRPRMGMVQAAKNGS
jgi:hypothetical protein